MIEYYAFEMLYMILVIDSDKMTYIHNNSRELIALQNGRLDNGKIKLFAIRSARILNRTTYGYAKKS